MRTLGTAPVTLLLIALLGACGTDEDSATAPGLRAEEPASSSSPTTPTRPESTTLQLGSLDVVGSWETGELLGERMPAGTAYGVPQVVYAVADTASTQGDALVALGLQQGDRLFRTLPALTPEKEEAADGIDLYGGNLADGNYELVGAVPGTVTVSIEGPDGRSTEATSQSGAVLPGWTVFHHRGTWRPGWDQVQLAPVAVTTDTGARVEVRERSWSG
ncbi:hypothetical protein EXE58_03960 [Nocardioides seonyuensis]|uniref:Lipoprotein n=1 Tax=Nocardioides seonyuensis TaxID=2518371 RepID=A0A4V1BM06_9ACTN|nr:hypothetical protein [Nocardioides seonyuensis]QBX54702.1 hypothetical protein EXE58_03960 [Nocardioides seonyuensis]